MTSSPAAAAPAPFFGPRVVRAAFVMAVCGWGIGFYGPPVFLHEVIRRTGWSLALVSSAVTLHFLFGALVVTQLPAWHRRWGVGPVAVAGAACAAVGVIGWSLAIAPWQLFVAAAVSGGGWVTMGPVAINAAVSPWFARRRPQALASAYNGASIGGVVFSPLWVALIGAVGFVAAAGTVGLVTVAVLVLMTRTAFAATPQSLGQHEDGAAAPASSSPPSLRAPRAPLGRALWRDRRFVTLAAGAAIGLFAQIGLVTHLFSLMVPMLGVQRAGWAMGAATACAIAGRWVAARTMGDRTDRRVVVAGAYAVQAVGTLALIAAGDDDIVLVLLGVALFGSGLGNATTLPPLIAQAEFDRSEVQRVVALVVALGQGTYAFAPALCGAVLSASGGGSASLGHGATAFLALIAVVQATAITIFLAGRR